MTDRCDPIATTAKPEHEAVPVAPDRVWTRVSHPRQVVGEERPEGSRRVSSTVYGSAACEPDTGAIGRGRVQENGGDGPHATARGGTGARRRGRLDQRPSSGTARSRTTSSSRRCGEGRVLYDESA